MPVVDRRFVRIVSWSGAGFATGMSVLPVTKSVKHVVCLCVSNIVQPVLNATICSAGTVPYSVKSVQPASAVTTLVIAGGAIIPYVSTIPQNARFVRKLFVRISFSHAMYVILPCVPDMAQNVAFVGRFVARNTCQDAFCVELLFALSIQVCVMFVKRPTAGII